MGLAQGTSTERQTFDSPETADAEGALRRLPLIAIQQTIAGADLLADSAIGQRHSLRIGSLKPIPWNAQQRRIDLLSVKNARIAAELFIPRERFNLTADALAFPQKLFTRSASQQTFVAERQQAGERGPAQET